MEKNFLFLSLCIISNISGSEYTRNDLATESKLNLLQAIDNFEVKVKIESLKQINNDLSNILMQDIENISEGSLVVTVNFISNELGVSNLIVLALINSPKAQKLLSELIKKNYIEAQRIFNNLIIDNIDYALEAIKRFIDAGINVNYQDLKDSEFEKTPLILATQKNRAQIVAILLENKADLLLTDNSRLSANDYSYTSSPATRHAFPLRSTAIKNKSSKKVLIF